MKRSFLHGRPVPGRGNSLDKEGQSPEDKGLGGLSRRRSLKDEQLDPEGGEQCLWEDCGVNKAQRQKQRREFEGWRSSTWLGWRHRM